MKYGLNQTKNFWPPIVLSGHQQWSVQEQQKEGDGEEVDEEDEEQEEEVEEEEEDTKLPKASDLLSQLQATQGPVLASFWFVTLSYLFIILSHLLIR